MITEARRKARDKARKLSVVTIPKVSFKEHYKVIENKCWGKTGHAFSNKLLVARRDKQKFEDQIDYAG
jgi:hypothetical protein